MPEHRQYSGFSDLVRQRLDDVQIGRSRDQLIEVETGLTQQVSVFPHRALLPSGHEHHHYIRELAGRWRISFSQRPLDQQEGAVFGDRMACQVLPLSGLGARYQYRSERQGRSTVIDGKAPAKTPLIIPKLKLADAWVAFRYSE